MKPDYVPAFSGPSWRGGIGSANATARPEIAQPPSLSVKLCVCSTACMFAVHADSANGFMCVSLLLCTWQKFACSKLVLLLWRSNLCMGLDCGFINTENVQNGALSMSNEPRFQ